MADEHEIGEYARRTWVDEEWLKARLRQKKPCARSFCGMPVEANGKRWGVIVLDSRIEDGIRNPNRYWRMYRLVAVFLGTLVERA
jgi:hypothetical protein